MPNQPNILLAFPDSWRGSALSCGGDPNVSTPTVDRLAGEGTRFRNAYSTYPVCVPTRFTLMTGEYAHSRYIPSIGWQMPKTERTLADEFADAGYQTANIGQYHLAGYGAGHGSVSIHSPQLKMKSDEIRIHGVPGDLQGGFEYFRGFHGGDHFDVTYFADDDPTPRSTDGYQTDVLTDMAIEFISNDRDSDRPFFLRFGPIPPHAPHTAPESYMDRFRDVNLDLRPNVMFETGDSIGAAGSRKSVEAELKGYYAMIENFDDNLARLLDALETEGLRENTIVIVLSDHGEMLGSHGHMAKQWPYEESAGVPFIVSHPHEQMVEEQVITEPTCSEDWFPTLLGLADIEPSEAKPGTDLSPLVTGEIDSLERPGVLLEFVEERREGFDWYDEVWRAFVTKEYKYTVKGGGEGGTPWQLFDLVEDPYELENLIEDPDYERIATELHGHLRNRLQATTDCFILQPAFGHAGYNEID